MVNVTITLPVELLDEIDDLVEEGKIVSRSKFIREAAQKHIKTL